MTTQRSSRRSGNFRRPTSLGLNLPPPTNPTRPRPRSQLCNIPLHLVPLTKFSGVMLSSPDPHPWMICSEEKNPPCSVPLTTSRPLRGQFLWRPLCTRRARFNRSALEAEQQIVNPSSSGQGFPRPRLDRSFVDVVKQRSLPIGRSPLTGIRMSATQGTVRPPLIRYPLYV
jgi:hypothetical protein